MRKGNTIVSTALFLMLVLFVFLSVSYLTGRIRQEEPQTLPGYADLSGFDFAKKLAYIPHISFLYYRNELYTPEDFKLGQVQKEPTVLTGIKDRFDPGNYGTYRIVLKLPEEGTYGLSSYSAMYSQRLFINGTQYSAFGVTGKTAPTTVPQTKHYTFYFVPQDGQAEIIIQFANYSHADYGGIVPIYVGSQDKITERDAIVQQRIHILAGCSITVFLFFMGMFFFFHKRYSFLWFSLACLSMGLRALIVNEKVIMLLLPDLPWKASIGLEYLTLILLLFSFLLYIHSMFLGALHKAALWVFGGVCALFVITVLFTNPLIYTRFMLWYQSFGALFGIYVVAALSYNFVRKKDNRHAEHVLVLIGVFIFIVLSVLDIQVQRSGGYKLALGLTEAGMMVLIFANMIALTLRFSRTELELDNALRTDRDMQETNQLLDRMSHMKSDFMANISHEMKTPLTVMASYAGLTAIQLQRGATDEKTLDNLTTIKREAIRLASLVEQLKEVSLEKDRLLNLTEVNVGFLMRQVADFCTPICLKNKNRIFVRQDSDKILLHANGESIFQVLVNLITNANRHTREGIILLYAEVCPSKDHDGMIKLTVSDDGEGIASGLLHDLFERGVSGDGGSGLGLAICKEIIEEHGGEIWVDSEAEKGTRIYFTLPGWKGVEDNEKCNDTDG